MEGNHHDGQKTPQNSPDLEDQRGRYKKDPEQKEQLKEQPHANTGVHNKQST